MRHALALVVAVTLALAQGPPVVAQLESAGVILGTLSGADGALAGLTVQALDVAGAVAGSAVTGEGGLFTLSGLNPGTFTIQAFGSNGAVIGVSSATLSAGAMTASVLVEATAGVVAGTAAAAAAATAASSAGISTGVVLAAVGAAAAGLGTLAVIPTDENISGSR